MTTFSVIDTYTTAKAVDISVEPAPVIPPVPNIIPMTMEVGLATVTEALDGGKFMILAPEDYTIKVDISYSGTSDGTVFALYSEKLSIAKTGGITSSITKISDITIPSFEHAHNSTTIPAIGSYSATFNAGDLIYLTAGITKGHISVKSTITFSYSTEYSQSGDITKASGKKLTLPESIHAPTVSGEFIVRIESSFNIPNLALYLSPSGSPVTVGSTNSVISILITIQAGTLPTMVLRGAVVPYYFPENAKYYDAEELLKHTKDKKISVSITLIRLN